MKSYTIKEQAERILNKDYTMLSKLNIYYELHGFDIFENFDFNDDFINVVYFSYIDNYNYHDICSYCTAIYDYFTFENINPATITTGKQLHKILDNIY